MPLSSHQEREILVMVINICRQNIKNGYAEEVFQLVIG